MTPPAIAPQSSEGQPLTQPEPSLGEWPLAPAYAESSADPDWRQILSAIDARIASFEARVERATAEFESVALARLQQSFGETIRQAQERMKHYAEACGHSRLVDLEAELERQVEPFLNRSQVAISDLERLLEILREEQHAWEARMAQQHQQKVNACHHDPIDLQLQRLSESLGRDGRHQ